MGNVFLLKQLCQVGKILKSYVGIGAAMEDKNFPFTAL